MKLEEQVCSLELAKRLAELGVKQESLFYWYGYSETNNSACISYTKGKKIGDDYYSAFTVAELGEMLPLKIIKENQIEINGNEYLIKFDYHFKISPFVKGYWHCCCIGYPILEGITLSNLGSHSFSENDTNMANAVAKMLIHLIENKLMEVPKCLNGSA